MRIFVIIAHFCEKVSKISISMCEIALTSDAEKNL